MQNGGRIAADAGRNALIVSGDPATQQVLSGLIDAFDIDTLAGQSYALLPVTSGDAKDFASAMQDGLRGAGGALASVVRVIPMARISSVLVVSSQPRYIEEARRIYGLVERKRRLTVRSWHVYYLQNSRSNDTAYVLQQAFTPNNVTATPHAASARGGNHPAQRAGGAGGGWARHRRRHRRCPATACGTGWAAGLGGGGAAGGARRASGPARGRARAGPSRPPPATRCSAGWTAATAPAAAATRTRCASSRTRRTTRCWSMPRRRRTTRSRRCCASSTSCRCRSASTPPSPK